MDVGQWYMSTVEFYVYLKGASLYGAFKSAGHKLHLSDPQKDELMAEHAAGAARKEE